MGKIFYLLCCDNCCYWREASWGLRAGTGYIHKYCFNAKSEYYYDNFDEETRVNKYKYGAEGCRNHILIKQPLERLVERLNNEEKI